MPQTYRITEPHPSLPASHYYHSGRGGAGNTTYIRDARTITNGQTAMGPASAGKIASPSPNAYFASGRGGAGNLHRSKERAMFSFDEELAQQQRLQSHAAPVYHIGRGGAGNFVDEKATARKNSASSVSSTDSDESPSRGRRSVEDAWHRLTRSLSRQN